MASSDKKLELDGIKTRATDLKKADTKVSDGSAREFTVAAIAGGKASDGLKKADTNESTTMAREKTALAIAGGKARKSLKSTTTVVKEADLKAQIEGEKEKIALLVEDRTLMEDIVKGFNLKKTEEKETGKPNEAMARALTTIAVKKGVNLKKAETVFKQADLQSQLDGFKEISKLSDSDKSLFDDIIQKAVRLRDAELKEFDTFGHIIDVYAQEQSMAAIKSGKARKSLKTAQTTEKQADLKAQLDGFKETAELSPEEKSLMNSIAQGTQLKSATTKESEIVSPRDKAMMNIKDARSGLKAATTVVKQADLKTQLEGFALKAGLSSEDNELMSAIIKGIELKKAEVNDAQPSETFNLATLAIKKGVTLKKAETVLKQADFEKQLEGFKEVAELAPEEKTMMEEIIHGIRLRKANTKEADVYGVATSISARDDAMGAIKGDRAKKSLKATKTTEKQADLKSQLDGFKETADLSTEEKSLMESIAAGKTLNKTTTKEADGTARDKAMMGIANRKKSLKKTTTVEKTAALKAQLEGFKEKAALSTEESEIMSAIIKGIDLKSAVTKVASASAARDAATLALRSGNAKKSLKAGTKTVEKQADLGEQLKGEKFKIELTEEDQQMFAALRKGLNLKNVTTKEPTAVTARDAAVMGIKGGLANLKSGATTLFKMASLQAQITGEQEKIEITSEDKKLLADIAKSKPLRKVTTKESTVTNRELIAAAITGGKAAGRLKNAMTVVKQVDFKIQLDGEKQDMQFSMTLLEDEAQDEEEDSYEKLDVEALIEACGQGNLYGVVEAISACNGYINPIDLNSVVEGFTPLKAAATSGETEIVAFLLNIPGLDVNVANDEGDTALHAACQNNHEDVVNMLLANENILPDQPNVAGKKPESLLNKKKNCKKAFAEARKRNPSAKKKGKKPRRSLVMVTTNRGTPGLIPGAAALAVPK